MPKTESPHATHAVVQRFGEDDVAACIISSSRQKIISLDHTIVTLAEAKLTIVVEDRVVTIRVLP